MATDETKTGLFVLEHLPGPIGLVGAVAKHLVSLSESGDLKDLSQAVQDLDVRVQRLEALEGRRVRGNAARILEYTIRQSISKLWCTPDAAEVIEACAISPTSFREAAEELDALGLLKIDRNQQSPIGIVRARLLPVGYLRAGASAVRDIPVIEETYHVLSATTLLTKRDGAAASETLPAGTGIPLPRLSLTIEALHALGLVEGSGPGDDRWGRYRQVRATPLGRRALRGDDPLF